MPAETSTEELCEQARTRLAQRDVQGARELYELAIRDAPDHIAAHEGFGALCFALKDHARAIELFKRVVALDPKRVEPLVNLGAAYNRNGNFPEAIKTLRMAVTRDRRCAAAYYNLAFSQRNIHQLSMAVSAYKEAIRLDPEMWEAYVNLGYVLLDMKNSVQAALNFERALQLHPQSARARQGLLTARGEIEKTKNAFSPFGRLVDMEKVSRQETARSVPALFLSAEDRTRDRLEAHRLGKEAEQCAVVMYNQIKNELAPAILNLSRLLNEKDSKTVGQGIESLLLSRERFQKMIQIVSHKLTELRQHETAIQKLHPHEPRE